MKYLVCIMRNRQCFVICILGTGILLCAGCAPSSSVSNSSPSEAAPKNCQSYGPMFDCAASCLYGLSNKSGFNLSYEDCVSILPRSEQGNNMLEVKRALQSLGFDVRAEKLSTVQSGDINTPCVVLLLPSGINTRGMHSRTMGHYLILWPVDAERIDIIDYPRPAFTLNRNFWVGHLQTMGINDIPALICYSQTTSLHPGTKISDQIARRENKVGSE